MSPNTARNVVPISHVEKRTPATAKHSLQLAKSKSKPQSKEPAKSITTTVIPREFPKAPSPLPLAESSNFQTAWRENMTYLKGNLPKNSLPLFAARKYGNHIGVPCRCPHCEDRPPWHIKPWNRWRWLTFHIAVRHAGKS